MKCIVSHALSFLFFLSCFPLCCSGGGSQYANLVLQNWTTCTTTSALVLSRATASFTGTQKPYYTMWQNMSAPGYPPAGMYIFQPATSQSLRWLTVADKAEGQPVSNVNDVGRDGLGWTIIFNVMQFREQCNQYIYYNKSDGTQHTRLVRTRRVALHFLSTQTESSSFSVCSAAQFVPWRHVL